DGRALDALFRRAARGALQPHALAPVGECAVVVVVLPPTDRRTLTRYAVTTHLPNSLANVSSVRRRTTSLRLVGVCESIRKMNVVATSASLPVGTLTASMRTFVALMPTGGRLTWRGAGSGTNPRCVPVG